MRIEQYVVVLDACVLVPMPVADTLIRLAEEPAFYIPKWSADILEEVRRTLLTKLGYSEQQVTRRITQMQAAFADATVEGYHDLIAAMTNDPKDRHVLAAAVRCNAGAIVTHNTKHFPPKALEPYNIDCISADDFMKHQYHLDPDLFISILKKQASDIKWTLPDLLAKHVPCLTKLISSKGS